MKRMWLFLFFLPWSNLIGALDFTISGYVIDQETGETMIGVNVLVLDSQKGAATDGNGYFRITGMRPGEYTLKISYIGYLDKKLKITIANTSLVLDDIALQAHAIELEEIVVAGERSQIADVEIEARHLEMTPRAVRTIPTSQDDVFRALKYLPGIEGIDTFSPLFSARGGESGENLVLLDGVTIYNPYHFITSSGLFNIYAIKNIELMVGGFSAEYGGRNSSILYLTTREGNNKTLHGELEATTSHTRMIFDFPASKNITMMVSARAYYGLVNRFFFDSPSYFYDLNISLNWILSRQHRLNLRYFFSRDLFDYSFARFSSYFATTFATDLFDDYDVIYKNTWNNQATTAILKSILTPNVYLQTQVSGSFFSSENRSILDFEYYDKDNDETIKLLYGTNIKNKIRELNVKSVVNVTVNSANTVKVGAEYSHYYFNNDMRINYFSAGTATRKPDLLAGFVEDKLNMGRFSFRPGIRFSRFSYANLWHYEPRVNAMIDLPLAVQLKAAWGKYYQYIVSINSQEYELSQFLDNYYPLKINKPSTSTHYLLGLEKSTSEYSHFSVDLYYKDISRIYTFDADMNILEVSQFTDKLRPGHGKSYGMEIMWQGTWKRLSGWISYGLSRAERSYPHIMNGKSFLFDYDRTHSLKAVLNHQVHPAISYSGSLRIISGVPKTLEKSAMSYFYYDAGTGELAKQFTYVADRKNNIRLPVFIRLDLGLKKRIRRGFGAELAEFLGAKESYVTVTFGNLLFLRRNVWIYIPLGEAKYYGLGTNYVPEFGVGYTIIL